MRPRGFGARKLRQREVLQMNFSVVGCCAEQIVKLSLGGPQGSVRHIVDEPEDEGFVAKSSLRGGFDLSQHYPSLPEPRGPLALTNKDRSAASSALSKSSMMSSTCSIPMLSRIVSGVTPAFRCSSIDIWRCVVEAG